MQWDAGDFGGFSTVEPWLPTSAAFSTDNVETQLREPSSIYHLYRRLISARRQHSALSAGSYRCPLTEGDFFLYVRQAGSERIFIALNFGPEPISASLPREGAFGRVLVSSFGDREMEPVNDHIDLRGDEGLVIGALAKAQLAT
jgi:alpha-glucosidase